MSNVNVTSKLIIPLAIWGQQPPTHCISCLEISPDQSILATGTNDGQICLWHVDNDMTLQPRMMLFGHTAAVTCMTMTTCESDVCHLISASDNGEISLWDCKDGQCLENRKTIYTHTAMKSHLMMSTRESRVICNGTYSEIQIMDALSLRILIRLTARIQSNWISALCILRPVKQEADVIVAISNSGTVKVWALSSENSSDMMNSSISEDESKQLRCLGAQTLTCCPYNQRTVLIVCSKYWQMYTTNYMFKKLYGLHNERHIYDAGDFSLLCSESCRRGNRWLGGDFIEIDRVIVFSNEGRAYLYQLPTNLSSDGEPAHGNPRSASQAGPQVYMMLDVGPDLCLERLRCTPVMKYFLGTRDKPTQLLIRGDSQGRVIIWDIPRIEKRVVKLTRQESVDKLPAITPLQATKLKDSWVTQNTKVQGFFDYLNKAKNQDSINYKENDKKVTSSVYIEVFSKLVCGRNDGSVVVVDALDSISGQLFGADKDAIQSNIFTAHTGAVTCILHPFSTCNDSKRYPKDLLVTGGADFTVCLWSLETFQRLFIFAVHGGEITQLLTPPNDCNTIHTDTTYLIRQSKILSTICSVSADHSVALLNVVNEFKCVLFASRHLFSVETIKWRPAYDFLIVLCTDGTVYVWQMETGHLDRVAHGVIGKDIISACKTSAVNESDRECDNDEEEPGEISISQAFRRRNIATFRNLAQQHLKRSSTNEQSDNQNRSSLPHPSIELNIGQSAMSIQTLETNFNDPLAHIVYFDIETLIVQLLNEEYVKIKEQAQQDDFCTLDDGRDLNDSTTTRRMSQFFTKMKDQAESMTSLIQQRPKKLATSNSSHFSELSLKSNVKISGSEVHFQSKQANDLPKSRESHTSAPVNQPQIPSRPVNHPQIPSRPVNHPQIPSRPVNQSQVPSRPVKQPQIPSRPVNHPQIPSQPVNHTQVPSRPVNQPQIPSRPVNHPQIPSRPVNHPQIPSQPVNQPQIPSRPVNQPPIPSRPVNHPQIPSRPVNQPQIPSRSTIHSDVNDRQFNPQGQIADCGDRYIEGQQVNECRLPIVGSANSSPPSLVRKRPPIPPIPFNQSEVRRTKADGILTSEMTSKSNNRPLPKRPPTIGKEIDQPPCSASSATECVRTPVDLRPRARASLSYVMKVAKLVTSVLHAWGLDEKLDHICSRRLGLIKPSINVSFGVMSKSGHMSLLLPGWSQQKDHITNTWKENSCRHWQISESLTTRHLLAVIALSNTLMSMSTATFLPSIDDAKCLDVNQPRYTGDVPSDNSDATVNQAQTKQGWSMLAALHCVLLPDIVGGLSYAPPQIEILVRRWQDRCLEIREASQALLLAELRRIGYEGRNALAVTWSTRMPGDGSNGSESLSSIIGADPLRPPPVATSLTAVVAKDTDEDDIEDQEDFEDLMLGSCKSITSTLSGETRRKQASAIVLMSVLGSEFGDTINLGSDTSKSTKSLSGFGVDDYVNARLTSNALSFLLLQPISLCLPAHTALRRAAVDLIGRGFTIWEPYLDVSAVLMAILRLCIDADILVPSLPLCAKADCCRSARHALSLVATSRPLAFITAMAKEVARHNARLSGQTSGHSSSGHSLATLSATSNLQTPLVKSKTEILRIIELLIEKIPNEICDLMMEVMDITLHCVDSSLAKLHGLKEIFPPIFKFSNVAYCPDTKKACVGARNGGVAFYDLKHTKTQITQLAGHKGPVSAVAFSPQGRYATSYSISDDKLLFWQMASTSLFGIGSQPTKCVRSYCTPKLDLPSTTSRVRRVRLVWIDANTCVLLAADGSEARYRI